MKRKKKEKIGSYAAYEGNQHLNHFLSKKGDNMECKTCGSEIIPDPGYETVGRCLNTACKEYATPVTIRAD